MAVGRRARRTFAATLRWGILAGFATALSFPFYWMLIATFKQSSDLYDLKNNPFLFHEAPTLDHLRLLWNETLFPRWLWNTTMAGVIVVAITLLLSLPAAYALARLTGAVGRAPRESRSS